MSALASLPWWGWVFLATLAAAVLGIPRWTRLANRADRRLARTWAPVHQAWCTEEERRHLDQLLHRVTDLQLQHRYDAAAEASDAYVEAQRARQAAGRGDAR